LAASHIVPVLDFIFLNFPKSLEMFL
jgi:hypothetical protein